MSRLRTLAVIPLLAALLVGCTGSPTAEPTPTPTLSASPREVIAIMSSVPGIVQVTASDLDVTALAAADAPDDQVLAAYDALQKIGVDYGWPGTIYIAREASAADDADTTAREPWKVHVYPDAEPAMREYLESFLTIEKIDGLVSITVLEGWPYAMLGSIETYATDFRTLAETPLFAGGGTMSLVSDDHLRIVWVPKHTTLDAINAIVAIARDYPAAEVLLEATTEGPQWPQLYIARISPEEGEAIERRLLDPALAGADVEGYGLPFILTTVGPSGPTYLEGNLGGVVE